MTTKLTSKSLTRDLIIAEAEKRGWQVDYIGSGSQYYRITTANGKSEIFWQSRPSRTSANGSSLVRFKALSMQFAEKLGYTMPAYGIVRDTSGAEAFLAQNGTIVVKPSNGTNSMGVSVNVKSTEQLHTAITYARENSENGKVLLQKQLEGKLYRLTVIHGKCVAGAYRRAAQVTGDGKRTARQLVEALDQEPLRSGAEHTPLRQVEIAAAEVYLGDAINRVPTDGEVVRVAAIESISAGGETVDVTVQIHEDWKKFMTEFAVQAGLFIAGFDVICNDVAQPLQDKYVPLLEVNSAPGFMSHEYPTGGGEAIHLAPILLDELFQ